MRDKIMYHGPENIAQFALTAQLSEHLSALLKKVHCVIDVTSTRT